MSSLEERVRDFHKTDFKTHKKLYQRLHEGQQPEILLITCADSRILPHQLLHAQPGELFILRNAGNIVPEYSSAMSESAGIEFALQKFPIKHIIICGHSQCGAMQGVLHKDKLDSMPAVRSWLNYAPTPEEIRLHDHSEDQALHFAIEKNIQLQMSRLQTYPGVKEKLARSELKVHGWVYTFEKGKIDTYNHELKIFEPLCPKAKKTAHSINYPFLLNCLSYCSLILGSSLLLIGLLSLNYAAIIGGGSLLMMHVGHSSYNFFTSQINSSSDNHPCDGVVSLKK